MRGRLRLSVSSARVLTLSRDRAAYSRDAGATATVPFVGTGIRWLGLPCELCGLADVLIDGTRVATVDTYGPARPAASMVMYTSPPLEPGSHTLTIEVAGHANPASADT